VIRSARREIHSYGGYLNSAKAASHLQALGEAVFQPPRLEGVKDLIKDGTVAGKEGESARESELKIDQKPRLGRVQPYTAEKERLVNSRLEGNDVRSRRTVGKTAEGTGWRGKF